MPCDARCLRVAAHMQGASGVLTLTEYGDPAGSKFVVKQVVDGAWVELAEEYPFYFNGELSY